MQRPPCSTLGDKWELLESGLRTLSWGAARALTLRDAGGEGMSNLALPAINDALIPSGVRGVLDEVPIEVLGAVVPPSRAALAQRDLRCMHGRSGLCQTIGLPAPQGRFYRPSRRHEVLNQSCSHLGGQRWIGGSPQATFHDDVASIRGKQLLHPDVTLAATLGSGASLSRRWERHAAADRCIGPI